MILVLLQVLVLLDVVHHVPQPHLRFLPQLSHLLRRGCLIVVELFLNGLQDAIPILAGVILHVFEEHAIDAES